MRTYTVRELRGAAADTRLVVDIVLHPDGDAGPGARWAASGRRAGDSTTASSDLSSRPYRSLATASFAASWPMPCASSRSRLMR